MRQIDECGMADSYAALFFFFGSILAFQPIVDVLRPQSHGVGRALLGMSSRTLPEVPNAKNPLVHRHNSKLLPTSQSRIKKISSTSTSKNRPIFERGTASDCFPSDYALWGKTRTKPLGEADF